MPTEVQSYSCPRCKRGEFRSLPGPDGKAFCPWCGDAVSERAAAPKSPPETSAPAEPASYAALAQRVASRPQSGGTEVRLDDGPDRIAEAERRREQAEAELRRELEKKQEIRKAVAEELGRLEAQVAEAKLGIRRKEAEHASALEMLGRRTEARERELAAELAALRGLLAGQEQSARDLEAQLKGRQKIMYELQAALDAVRIEADKLRSELGKLKGSSGAELADLRQKLAAAESRLQALQNSESQVRDLKGRLQEALSKAEGLQSELGQRDQRIKELQLLIKTLGERLNELTRRQF